MYTVAELIEALKKCPPNYEVLLEDEFTWYELEAVAIDNDAKTVDLFAPISPERGL